MLDQVLVISMKSAQVLCRILKIRMDPLAICTRQEIVDRLSQSMVGHKAPLTRQVPETKQKQLTT